MPARPPAFSSAGFKTGTGAGPNVDWQRPRLEIWSGRWKKSWSGRL